MLRIIVLITFFTLSVKGQYIILGPMVGHVDDKSANIWCMIDQPGTLTLKVSEYEDLRQARTVTAKNFELGSIKIDGLKPQKVYYYQLRSHKYSTTAVNSFKTAPETGKSVKMSFMFLNQFF